jgi:hypothetical protein
VESARKYFKQNLPASTLVTVSGLAHHALLIERNPEVTNKPFTGRPGAGIGGEDRGPSNRLQRAIASLEEQQGDATIVVTFVGACLIRSDEQRFALCIYLGAMVISTTASGPR